MPPATSRREGGLARRSLGGGGSVTTGSLTLRGEPEDAGGSEDDPESTQGGRWVQRQVGPREEHASGWPGTVTRTRRARTTG